MDKKDVVEQFIFFARKSLEPSDAVGECDPCQVFNRTELDRYVQSDMSTEEGQRFEMHCLSCPSCIKLLLDKRDAFVREQERLENEFLLTKTIRLLDRLDAKGSHLMEVIINAVKNSLQIMATTGEYLGTGMLLPARGEDEVCGTAGQSIKIIQDFAPLAKSVQVSLDRRETEDEVKLRISLLDTRTDDFLPGITITCTGPDGTQQTVTDENGEACFLLRSPAEYQAWVECGEQETITLRLVVSRDLTASLNPPPLPK